MAVNLGIPETFAGSLSRRLAWITGARLLFLSVALGLFFVFFLRGELGGETYSVRLVLGVLGVSFALAGAYATVLRSGRRIELLADVQLVLDQLTWTVIVYLSGGPASGATSFYGLSCLVGAILTGLRGAGLAAASGAAAFIAMVLMLRQGVLVIPPDQPVDLYLTSLDELLYHVLLNVLMLVVVALLAGYLAERLRITGGRLVQAEQRAEQAERMAALGRLAAGLAHEIRNPLGSIAGSIQLLRDNPELSEEDRQLCDIVRRETARLDDLVTDMMDLTRPRPPQISTFDVAELAREVVALAGASGRGAEDVSIVYDGAEHALVRADAAQLRQLVWNLVRNAVQASGADDEVRVSVEIDDQRQVTLAVADEGQGIDAEAKERLFDAFFTTRSHGTGVGLAVVKRIADEHGFDIEVESDAGRGASFKVALGGLQREEPGTTA